MAVPRYRRLRYVIAVGVALAATAATAVLWPWLAPSASVLFFPAVMFAATYGGLGPALVATVLSAASIAFFFSPPYWSFKMNAADVARLVAFVAATLLITSIANARRRAEEALRHASARAEQLYRALQDAFEDESHKAATRQSERLKAVLLDALTHNLRTPLTAIKAAVTALHHDEMLQEAETRVELLQVIEEEVDRLDRFVGGLGAPTPQHIAQPIAIAALVHKVREKAEVVLRRHHVVMDIDGSAPPVEVDPQSIVEALYLVVENAAKYSPPGTTIRLTATGLDAHHVRVIIADEGPGIPVEFRERVFEKFFRGDDVAAAGIPGTGLGLSVARQLVATQGGQIWIDDPPAGGGTRVVVTLPVVTLIAAADPDA